ncbi:MAG: 5'-methylthioadenosine/S-adenosylhomocysteine nucleosidase [Nitrospirales bacterium]|nr:MAG: 5'-methylthioadenosine/S-adenosylhomocysteine nucleosidase [Nitrospirales bacterium]
MRPFVSAEASQVKLAIFTATRWEYQAVLKALTVDLTTTMAGVRCTVGHRGRAKVSVFQSGIGPQKAKVTAQSVLGLDSWDFVVSSGFAGALVPCSVGTIVVGDEVVVEELTVSTDFVEQTPIVCHDIIRTQAWQVASSIDHGSQSGRIVCLPRIVGTGAEKKALAARTHAVALDMESVSLGSVAHSQQIPFIVVRTISDVFDEDLPIDFNLFLSPGDWMKGVSMIVRNPSSLIQIFQLRQQMLEASRTLSWFFQNFFDEIEQVHDSPKLASTR